MAVGGSRNREGRIPDGVVVTSCGGGLASSRQGRLGGVGTVTCAQNDRHDDYQQRRCRLSSSAAPVNGGEMARLSCADRRASGLLVWDKWRGRVGARGSLTA